MAHRLMQNIYFILLVSHQLLCVKLQLHDEDTVLSGAPLAAASLNPEHEMAYQVPDEFNLMSQQGEQAIKSIDMSGIPSLDDLTRENSSQVQPAQPVAARLLSSTVQRQGAARSGAARSVLLSSRPYQSANDYIEAAKPRFDYETAIQFQYNTQQEECINLAAEMKESSSTVGAGEAIQFITEELESAMSPDYTDLLNMDKNILNALNELYIAIPHGVDVADIGTSDGGKDISHFMQRLILCKVDVENDWTILQSMIAYGLTQTVKHNFIFQLLSGEYNLDPALLLDKHGNTLLHLAVMSGQATIFDTVISLEQRMNHAANRVHNFHLWTIACLTRKNDSQKKPLDLTTIHSFQNRIKGLFRYYTGILNNKIQKLQTLTSSTAQNMLGSKSTMPSIRPMKTKMVAAAV